MKTREWVIILAALTVIAAASFMAVRPVANSLPAMARESNDQQVIAVSGEATLTVAPDTVVVTLGVQSQAPSAQAAMSENAARMNALVAALTSAGVKKDDMKTIRFNVHPVYDYKSGGAPRLVGFSVSNSLQVTMPATTNVGNIIDQAAKAGANNIEAISYQVRDMAKYRDEALARAMADAKRRAETLARSAGVTIKGVKSVVESAGPVPPGNDIYEGARYMKAANAETPILSGEMTIRFSVRVEYIF